MKGRENQLLKILVVLEGGDLQSLPGSGSPAESHSASASAAEEVPPLGFEIALLTFHEASPHVLAG
jgi:hypothetical protein